MSIRAIAHPALPRRRRSRSPATRGRYPSAWLANNKALRLRSKGQVCHVEATEVADNQLRDFLGAVLRSCGGARWAPVMRWRGNVVRR
jgi:hypothetical protein